MLDVFFSKVVMLDLFYYILKVLTSPGVNYILLISLFFFFYNKLNYFYIFTLFIIYFKFLSFIFNKGLANSFSIIHPILILSIFIFFKNIFYKKINKNIFFIKISFIMGGFWAFQEYN